MLKKQLTEEELEKIEKLKVESAHLLEELHHTLRAWDSIEYGLSLMGQMGYYANANHTFLAFTKYYLANTVDMMVKKYKELNGKKSS
jgi:hypothetical protein